MTELRELCNKGKVNVYRDYLWLIIYVGIGVALFIATINEGAFAYLSFVLPAVGIYYGYTKQKEYESINKMIEEIGSKVLEDPSASKPYLEVIVSRLNLSIIELKKEVKKVMSSKAARRRNSNQLRLQKINLKAVEPILEYISERY